MKKSKAVLMGILAIVILLVLSFLPVIGSNTVSAGYGMMVILILLIVLIGVEVYRISCANQFYKKMLEIKEEEKDCRNRE